MTKIWEVQSMIVYISSVWNKGKILEWKVKNWKYLWRRKCPSKFKLWSVLLLILFRYFPKPRGLISPNWLNRIPIVMLMKTHKATFSFLWERHFSGLTEALMSSGCVWSSVSPANEFVLQTQECLFCISWRAEHSSCRGLFDRVSVLGVRTQR